MFMLHTICNLIFFRSVYALVFIFYLHSKHNHIIFVWVRSRSFYGIENAQLNDPEKDCISSSICDTKDCLAKLMG